MASNKKRTHIGDKIFSEKRGWLLIEAEHEDGKDREIMFTELGKEYWIKASRVSI